MTLTGLTGASRERWEASKRRTHGVIEVLTLGEREGQVRARPSDGDYLNLMELLLVGVYLPFYL